MSFASRGHVGLVALVVVLSSYFVPDAYRGVLLGSVIAGCVAVMLPVEALVWRTRILRRPYYAAQRWLSWKTVRRWWHRLFGHGTVVITPPETSPLATFMGGVVICGCGKQLGFWDTGRRWHGTA